jgi:hypothetical protein
MEELQRLLGSLGQLTNASTAAAGGLEGLAKQLGETTKKFEGAGDAAGATGGILGKLGTAAGVLTGWFIRQVTVQARLTRSIIDLNTQIYNTEDVFASMTAKTQKSFEYLDDIVEANTKGLTGFLKGIPVIRNFTKDLGEAGRAVYGIVKDQTAQNIKIIQSVQGGITQLSSNFGVITTDLQEFSTNANAASLTSDQFGKVLSNNADTLGAAFGGLQGASTAMSNAFRVLNDSSSDADMEIRGIRDRFVALGMNTDDVADLFSETAFRQRILTGQQLTDGAALTRQSFEYLKTMKGLSAITGEDLKTQRARQRELLNQANFAAKVEQLRLQGREAEAGALMGVVETYSAFGPMVKKLATEVAVYGRAYSREGNLVAMANKALYDTLQQSVSGVDQFTGTVDDAKLASHKQSLALIDANEEQIKQSRDATQTLAMMSGLSDAQPLQIFGGLFVETRKASQQLGELTTNFTSVMEALDRDLGNVSSSIADQNLADQISRVATEFRILGTPGMDGKTLAEHTLELSTAFGKMALELTEDREGLIRGITTTGSKFSEFVTDPSVEAFFRVFRAAGVMGPNGAATSYSQTEDQRRKNTMDTTNGELGEFATIAVSGRIKGDVLEVRKIKENTAAQSYGPGNANGGILSGPDTGYRALLHGTEAIVPLPDGKNIPVTLDTSKFDASITALLDGIPKSDSSSSDRLAQLMEQGIELNSEILDTLKQGNRTNHRMVRAIS